MHQPAWQTVLVISLATWIAYVEGNDQDLGLSAKGASPMLLLTHCLTVPTTTLSNGIWPSTCKYVVAGTSCQATCFWGGSAAVKCLSTGKWSTPATGSCNACPSNTGVSWTTHQFDLGRTGVNPSEQCITPTTVVGMKPAGVFPVDGYVYAQPLVFHKNDVLAKLGQLNLPGGTTCGSGAVSTGYNLATPVSLLVVATMTNWLYIFDADAPTPATAKPLFCFQLGSESNRVPLVANTDNQGCTDIVGYIGVTSTPTIDLATGTLYVVSKAKVAGTGSTTTVSHTRLYKLSLANPTPSVITPNFVDISGTSYSPKLTCGMSGGICTPCSEADLITACTGKSPASSCPSTPFSVVRDAVDRCGFQCKADYIDRDQYQRVSLALHGGYVYFAYASGCDLGNYRGWVFSYNTTDLSLAGAWTPLPGCSSGIWHAGGGVAVDETDGSVYVSLGNGGQVDPTYRGGYGNGVVKLSSGSLNVVDYFVPFNYKPLEQADMDMSSGGIMVVSIGTFKRVIAIDKTGWLYVLDPANMGGYNRATGATTDFTPQQAFCAITDATLAPKCCSRTAPSYDYNTCAMGTGHPAYFNGHVYSSQHFTRMHYWPTDAATGTVTPSPVYSGTTSPVNPSFVAVGTPTVSAYGTTNGVLWTNNGAASFTALDAGTGRVLLPAKAFTPAASFVKFTVPAVVNGQAYMGVVAGVAVLRF